MPKPDEEFKVGDWDWLSEHFEPSKAERMAKVAWSIARSTPETIPQHSLTLDPFIVIPLCAIALRDDINISILRGDKRLRSLVNEAKSTKSLQQQERFIEEVLDAIEPSPRWRYLFDSLNIDLQFDLLYRLINYRHPTIDDWHNLFREVKYEFKTSCHYRLVLFFALAMSMVAIAEILQIITLQPENWSNGLLGLAILVVIVFWIFLWQGIEKKLEPTTFTSFGLFGFLTFWRELRRSFKKKIVWAGVGPLYQCLFWTGAVSVVGVWVLAFALAWARAVALVLARDWSIALAEALAVSGAVALAVSGALAIALAVSWAWVLALAIALAVSWALPIAVAVSGALAIALAVSWAGAAAWAWAVSGAVAEAVAVSGAWVLARVRAKDKQDFGKFLAVFAFPFFCWSPIVIYFSTLALLEFLSWQYTLFTWLTLIGVGTALWLRGQKLEKQARNPLKGILNRTERLN